MYEPQYPDIQGQPNLFILENLPELDPEEWDIYAQDSSMKKVPTEL